MNKFLKVWIRKNLLTPNNYTAFVSIKGKVGMNEIVDELVNEGLEVKRETAIDILTRFNRKTAELVVAGYKINTGLVQICPSFKKIVNGSALSNEVTQEYITINPGMDLFAAIAETTVKILFKQSNPIEIISLSDTNNIEIDDRFAKNFTQN